MKRELRNLLLLYCLVIGIKSIFSFLISSPSLFADEYIYAKMAKSFFYNFNFQVHGIPASKYPPLLSIILSPAYVFGNIQSIYYAMKVPLILLSASIIFPIYFLLKEFLDEKKSLFITAIISFLSININFSNFILAENLFFPLFMFTFFFIYQAFVKRKTKYFVISGLLLGLTFLTKFSGIMLVPLCLAGFLWIKKDFRKVILHYFIAFMVIVPWFIRNVFNFGFSLKGLFGRYGGATVIAKNITNNHITLVSWFFLYLGYLLLASGIILGIYFLISWKMKNKNFRLLSIMAFCTTFFACFMAANQASAYYPGFINTSPFPLLTFRTIGRYVETVLPLFFILGSITFFKLKENAKTIKYSFLIATPILLYATQLILTPLFPANNSSLTYLGVIQIITNYILTKEFIASPPFNWTLFLIMGAIILFSTIGLYFIKEKKSFLLKALVIFVLLNTTMSFIIINWNNTHWENSDQMELASFFNNARNKSQITIDLTSCYDRLQKEIINKNLCDKNNHVSQLGFFINREIEFAVLNDTKKGYFVSGEEYIGLNLIYTTTHEIYVYEVN